MANALLIRHGQASFGADDYDQLSELGSQQARWLGAYMDNCDTAPNILLCGSLKRQKQTAEGIREGLSQKPEIHTHSRFNEFEFDAVCKAYMKENQIVLAPEAPPRDFYRILKHAMLAWQKGELDGLVEESWAGFIKRADDLIALLKTYSTHTRIAAVSSGGIIAAMVSRILDCAGESTIHLNLQIKNTSVSELYVTETSVRLHSFNHLPHLDFPERRNSITFS